MKKLILIPIIFLLCGCNYRELNDMAIVSAISVDKNKNNYTVVIQVVNPAKNKEIASTDEPDFITYSSTDNSLQNAFRKIVLESPKKIYVSQLQLLIISEDLARDDIGSMLDFFFRNTDVRFGFGVIIEKKNDNKAIKTLTTLDNLSSSNIISSLENDSEYLGTGTLITFEDLMNMYLDDNLEIILPSLRVIDINNSSDKEDNLKKTSNYSTVIIDNFGIFKGNRLIGFLNDNESIVYNILNNNIKETLITYNCDSNKYLVSEIMDIKSKLKFDMSNNRINIIVNGKGSIKENTCDYDLTRTKDIQLIDKKINERIEELITKSIYDVREKYNSDIWGFKSLLYKSNYEYFNNNLDWYMNIDVDSNIDIIEKGNIVGGIYDR